MNGLDLFSGIGGNSIALREWVNTIAYCEADRHAQSVLLSRMETGDLKPAPIWDDITTLSGQHFDIRIDIIIAGFPCQDISVAGRGDGLEGKRSGLFFEVVRLAKGLQPSFIFLENVPAITNRGLDTVAKEITSLGYDCRWGVLSAYDVGAPHLRERWFMLGYSKHNGCASPSITGRNGEPFELCSKEGAHSERESKRTGCIPSYVADALCRRYGAPQKQICTRGYSTFDQSWWEIEPNVGRVADELPFRVDRIKRLGNAVVPMQAKVAFEYLLMSKIPPKIDRDSGSVEMINKGENHGS